MQNKMKSIIIVGSNYGDEGKGLATSWAGAPYGERCLNILYNGGPQRGHTVERQDGTRHVFHHFGAASLTNARTFFDPDFMVNPIIFGEEFDELKAIGFRPSTCFISPDCRVTTVFDMMLNQIIEASRGGDCHGSCGYGIYETRHRFETHPNHPRFGALAGYSEDEFRAFYDEIRNEYVPNRLKEVGIDNIPEPWSEILMEDGLISHSRADLLFMAQQCECFSYQQISGQFDILLFEGAQGLSLDEHNLADYPHLTPSSTGSLVPSKRLSSLAETPETEIIYVTRTYLTRHGAGPLPTECDKDSICADMTDQTNVPNPFQKSIRYGLLDGETVLRRIQNDFVQSQKLLPNARKSIFISHLNETNGKLTGPMELDKFVRGFYHVYSSYSPFGVVE